MAHGTADDVGKTPMSHALQATLVRAREYASAQSHAQVTLEHLLLALTEDEEANAVLQACKLDMARLRNDVAAYLGDLADRVPQGSGTPPAISMALTQVLGYATLAAKQGRRQKIDGAIVLAAMIGDGKSMAASFLTAQGLTFQETVRVLQRTAVSAPGGSVTQAAAQHPTYPAIPAPVIADATSKPLDALPASRTESILAAARERIEARSLQTPRPTPVTPMDAPTPHEQVADADFAAGHHQVAPAPPLPPMAPSPGDRPPAPPPLRDRLAALPPLEPPELSPQTPSSATALAPNLIEQPHETSPRTASSWAPPPLPIPGGIGSSAPPRPQPNPTIHPPYRPAPKANVGPEQRPVPDMAVPAPWSDPDAANPPERPHTRPQDLRPPYRPEPAGHHSGPPAGQRRAPPQDRHRQTAAPPQRLPPIDVAQVSHTVPLRLRVGRPVTVEVKVGRPPMAGLGAGPSPSTLRTELVTARAITARLRPAKPSSLTVEALSPETQWDQTNSATGRLTGEAAIWRFTLTPKAPGAADILLLITARTIAADGVLADMTLPDMVIEAKVATDWANTAKRYGAQIGLVVGAVAITEILRLVIGIDIGRVVRRLIGL